jgi:regulator of sigma E protease
MVDESMNTEQLKEPVKPWEFRSKSAWQRLLIMVGGVLFNFLLALFLYAAVLYEWGEEYLPVNTAPMGMQFSEAAHQMGFQDGDCLIAADGVTFERFDEDLLRSIADADTVYVLRKGEHVSIPVPDHFIETIIAGKQGFADFRFPSVIRELAPGSPAKKAGLLPGDSLVAINHRQTPTFYDFTSLLSTYKDTAITLEFYRQGKLKMLSIHTDENGKLGFYPKHYLEVYPTRRVEYSLISAIPAGISKGIAKLTGYASDMKYVFTKEGAKSIGGFGAIGSLFPPVWNWQIFWEMTAFLSIILAFMNILPIPGLDGGHILFLLYEVVTRRKPGDKFLEYAQITGMFLLLALLIYANANDIYKWLFK